MKKLFLIFALAMFTFFANAQIKVISTGYVGIGTTTPPAKLTINGGKTNSTGISVKSGNVDLLLTEDSATNAGKIQVMSGDYNNIGNTPYTLSLQPQGGYVGLGITSPQALFHIKSTSTTNAKVLQLTNATTGSNSGDGFIMRSGSNGNDFELINQETGYFNFYTSNSKRMTINPIGNIGIGISQPLYKIHVEYSDDFPGFYVNKSSTTSYASNIASNVNANLTKSFLSLNNGTSNFCVWGDGQVNVGAVYHDGTYKLTVYGSAYATGIFYSGSDINFKQNLMPIATAIDKLNQLNGYRYSYNTTVFSEKNFPTGYTYGVIAQEVQAVLPELVMADSAGYLAVNYDGLIPILIEAVKSQQFTIKTQEERINTIENDLANCCNIKPTEKMMNQTQGSNNSNNNSTTATLYQNVPNPFKIKTTIRYYLPSESNLASMLIFDMQGKLIKTYNINTTGDGNIEINAGQLQPGMYMYSLIANGKEVDTKKMILTE